ncbi:MAG TPA: ThuA domain-containing protein [Rhodothermales bacterium]|nr:ThuA domain-containing protein [Rhodothermales bacterium]
MRRCALLLLALSIPLLTWLALRPPPEQVLIIQDERPQIDVLSAYLEKHGDLDVSVIEQDALPADLSHYKAVLLFVHGDLDEAVERAVIAYTKGGGRFIPLHHAISSGKAANEHYFDFLGIRLDNPTQSSGPVEPGGGYGWRHEETDGSGVTLTVVNLNPHHYITSHEVDWGEPIPYTSSDTPSVEEMAPSISLPNSEVYLNHKFTDGREKTVLMGLKYYDDRTGKLFMQDRAGWIKRQGEGEIIYLMPGHSVSDYQNPNVAQMILNAIEWQP